MFRALERTHVTRKTAGISGDCSERKFILLHRAHNRRFFIKVYHGMKTWRRAKTITNLVSDLSRAATVKFCSDVPITKFHIGFFTTVIVLHYTYMIVFI